MVRYFLLNLIVSGPMTRDATMPLSAGRDTICCTRVGGMPG